MSVKFYEIGHKYESIDAENPITWVSVTKLIDNFKEPFNANEQAAKCSKGKNPKYNKLSTEEILEVWNNENKRALKLGSWYHDQREKDILSCNTITREGVELTIIDPLMDGDAKLAPVQQLAEGIYPEHLVYLSSVGVCGQADRIEVVNSKINVYDYKTNKEIKMQGFTDKRGKTKKMLTPLSHLEQCNFNEYALQLSAYLYIMLKHNSNLSPGKIQLDHVEFETSSLDKNGYPIHLLDKEGNPVVKKVTPYALPYLKKEVAAMFKYAEEYKNKLIK